MSGKQLEEKVASSSELSTGQAVAALRDVILGNHPNDAESIKAKELARHPFYQAFCPYAYGSGYNYEFDALGSWLGSAHWKSLLLFACILMRLPFH